MTDFLTSQLVLLAACALPWLIAGWLRIPRYARYLQSEGYENQCYARWLEQQDAETRYGKILRRFLLVLLILSCAGYFSASLLPGIPIIALAVSGGLASLAFYLAPKDTEVKQQFTPARRTGRLLITAFILETVPTIIAGLVIFALVRGLESPTLWAGMTFVLFPLVIWTIFFLAVMAGAVGYVLTPFLLPVANLLPMHGNLAEMNP